MKKYPKFVWFMAAILVLPLLGNIAPASAAYLPAPYLSAPTSDQILTNYPRNATFSWSAVSGANHYQLEIACDVCVSKTNLWANAKTYTANGTSYTVKVPGADNQFRWRVRAYDSSNNAGVWSGYQYFKYKTSTQTSSDKPVISQPQIGQQFNSTNIDLDWSDVTNASRYSYVIEKWNSSSQVWEQKTSLTTPNSGSFASLDIGNYGGGQYRLRVYAVYSSNGTYGTSSDWRYFNSLSIEETQNNAPEIYSPASNALVENTSRNVYLSWENLNSSAYAYQLEVVSDNSGTQTYSASNNTSYNYYASGNDTWYHFRIRAQSSNGDFGPWSEYRYFQYRYSSGDGGNNYSAPIINNPWNGQTYTDHNVSINWTSVSGCASYEVNINYESNSNWYEEGTYPATGQNYNKYFSNDNHYRVRVRGKFSDGNYTNWSDWREFTVGNSSGQYNNLGVTTISMPNENQTYTGHAVAVNWWTVSGASRYEMQVQYESNSNWYEEGYHNSDSASYQLTLNYNNHYRLRVRAVNGSNYGDWSSWRTFYVNDYSGSGQYGNLNTPAITAPTEGQSYTSSQYVTVNWYSIFNASNYELQVQYESNSTWYDSYDYTTANVSYQIYFSNNNHYRVRVRATNGTSYSNWSDWRTFYIGSGSGQYYNLNTPTLSAPTEGQSYSSSQYVTASWYSIYNASSYELQTQYESGGNWYDSTSYTTSDISYQIYYSNNNHYRVRVRAVNGSNYSNWSDWRTFYVGNGGGSTGSVPIIYTPAENQAINQHARSVNLGWYGVTNASSYEVEVSCDYCDVNASQWAHVNTYITYSANLTYETPGADNTYRVRARAYLTSNSYSPWSDYRTFHYFQTYQ